MPLKLSTTIGKIQNIPNSKNIEFINEFLEYMRSNGSSEHHQNNNLKVVLAFANFIGKANSFCDINKKDQVLEFLNTKVKSYDKDPDKRWITTWNNYLNRLRLFYRWLYNHQNDIDHENWQTPEFIQIKNKKRQEYLLQQIHTQVINSNTTSTAVANDNNKLKLFLGDFRDKAKEISDNSIDLIFTDPPYADTPENLVLHEELAKLALRVLKPGSSLVTFVGHIIMDKVIEIFNKYSLINDTSLKYWWIFAVKHSGNHTKIYPRNVFAEWKPMLWYVKRGKNRANNLAISNTIGDHIESTSSSKTFHKWKQSTVEAQYIIKNLTIENQKVLDPMVGSGTTGVAALKLNRKFVGIEQDSQTFKIAKRRITKYIDKKKVTNTEYKK